MWGRRFRVALSFLTRLPGGVDPADDAELAGSLAAFPLVGALLGAVIAGVLTLAAALLPAQVAAVLAFAALVAATGGLHLDGLADTFDALGSGKDRARRLEIMRDSRIGAHGATALALFSIAAVGCLEALVERGVSALIGALAVARSLVVVAIALYPYARAQGLGRPFAQVGRRTVLVAAAIGLVAALLAPSPGALAALGAAFVASLVALGFWAWLARSLGGLTGDTYGAGIVVAEVAYLCAVAAAC